MNTACLLTLLPLLASPPAIPQKSVHLKLAPQSCAEMTLGRGHLLQISGALDGVKIYRRSGAHPGEKPPQATVDLQLRPRIVGVEKWQLPPYPFARQTLVFKNGGNRAVSLWLSKISSTTMARHSSNWRKLERSLWRWVRHNSQRPIPIPWWIDTALRQQLHTLSLTAAALHSTQTPEAVRQQLLLRSIDQTLEQHRPLAGPWYQRLSTDDLALWPAVLAQGEKLVWTAPRDLVVQLRYRAQECSQLLVKAGAHPVGYYTRACPKAGLVENTPGKIQFAMPRGAQLTVQATRGAAELSFSAASRRLSLDRMATLLQHQLAQPQSNLAMAEALRLQHHRSEATEQYSTIQRTEPNGFVAAFAALRLAQLQTDPELALAHLLVAAAIDSSDTANSVLLRRQVVTSAIVQSLRTKVPSQALQLLQLQPELTATTAAALLQQQPGTWHRDPGLGLLLEQLDKNPQLRQHSHDIARYYRGLNHWHPIELTGKTQQTVIEPLASIAAVDRARQKGTLLTPVHHPTHLQIAADSTGLDRLARVPFIAQPTADSDSSCTLTIDGHRLWIWLNNQEVRGQVALKQGEYRFAAQGCALWVKAPRAQQTPSLAAQPRFEHKRLRRYLSLGPGEQTQGTLLDPGVETFLGLDLQLPTDAENTGLQLEVCLHDDCHPVDINPAQSARTTAPREMASPLRLRLRLPRSAQQLTIRRRDHHPQNVLIRAWLKTHRPQQPVTDPFRRLPPRTKLPMLVEDKIAILQPEHLLPPSPEKESTNTWRMAQQQCNQRQGGAAAERFLQLAAAHPQSRALWLVKAARCRLQTEDPEQWRRAYAEAVAAGTTPGAYSIKQQARLATRWQRIPSVQRSAGQVRLKRLDDSGEVKRFRAQVATAHSGVQLTVLGPTVIRVRARSKIAPQGASALQLTVNQAPVTVPLNTNPDPLVSVLGRGDRVGSMTTHLLAILQPGPQQVHISPDRGTAWITLSLRAPKNSVTQGTTADPKPPQPAATISAAPPWLTAQTSPRAARLPRVNIDPPVPVTTVVQLGYRHNSRSPESSHYLADPLVPLSLTMHRHLRGKMWASMGPRLRLRSRDSTLGAVGRFDYGSGAGFRHSVSLSAYTQQFQERSAVEPLEAQPLYSGSARGVTGWHQPLFSILSIRGELSYSAKILSRSRKPGGVNSVDPLVYSSYGRDHPLAAGARLWLYLQPTRDLRLKTGAAVVSNADLQSLDYYQGLCRLDGIYGPSFFHLGYAHRRYLADQHRFLPYSRNWLFARVGLFGWIHRGHRVAVYAQGRFTVETARPDIRVLASYELSLGRGLTDIAPQLQLFRTLLASEEPSPWEATQWETTQ